MASKRQAFVLSIYGRTGSGKSVTQIEICKQWKKANPGEKVIGFDPHEVFTKEKLLTHTISANDENWAEILMTRLCVHCGKIKHPEKDNCLKCGKNFWKYKFYGSLLIVDDLRNLLGGDRLPEDVLALFGLKRKLKLDIIISFHNPKMLIKRIAPYVTSHLIFSTQAVHGDFSDKIDQYVPCQRAANLVNEYVKYIGGVESDTYRKMYPNFPHVIVTNASEELNPQNMDFDIIYKLKEEGKI